MERMPGWRRTISAVRKDKSRPRRPPAGRSEASDAAQIDRLYGLEPVYEPSQASGGVVAEQFVAIRCPYCGEPLETRVDLTGGAGSYIEDCQVCCRPMEIGLELAANGALDSLKVRRTD
jgi:hypothetical protein